VRRNSRCIRSLFADGEGWTARQLWDAVVLEATHIRRHGQGTSSASECAAVVDRLAAEHPVFQRRALLLCVAEALQTECTADEILAAVDDLENRRNVVRVGSNNGERVYSTEATVATERDMLRIALERRDEREFVGSEIVERIIAQRPELGEEQRIAVRYAFNRDGISVIEGSAAVGSAMEAIASAAREAGTGLEFRAIAPSRKAAAAVGAAAGTPEDLERAVQRGETRLSRFSVVCLKNGSIVGLKGLATLTRLCAAASAKLVVCCDTRPLQPLTANLPVAALARVLGSSRVDEIRQNDPNHRAASMDLATGDPVRALESYDRAGAIIWARDREELIARLAADYVNDRIRSGLNQGTDHGAGRSRAVLASWNHDVDQLNRRIRILLRRAGGLTGEDFRIAAVSRGGGKPGELALAAGDDVIFGEPVEVGGHTIRKADIGQVLRISGHAADPVITILFADGAEVAARASDLVGRRREGQPRCPRIQHAFAITVYASQGITIDDCYVANLRGLSREATCVAMTRHRARLRLYVDQSRIRDALAARRAADADGASSLVEPPEGGDDRGEPSEITIRTAIMGESRRSDRKVNVSDFADDIKAWVRGSEPAHATSTRSGRPHRCKTAVIRDSLAQPVIRLSPSAGRPAQHSSTAADHIALRMSARAKSPARYTPTGPVIGSKRPPGRTMRDEMSRLLRPDPSGSPSRQSGGQRCDVWNTEIRVVAGRRTRTAISRVGGRTQQKRVPAREWWCRKFGTWMRTATRPRADDVRARLARPGALAVSVRQKWHAMKAASVEQPALSLPGIRAEMPAFCQADICIDAAPETHDGPDLVALVRRNVAGELVGLNRYRVSGHGRPMLVQSEGEGGLYQAGNLITPDRIHVTDHAIEALLMAVSDTSPQRPLFVATDGVTNKSVVATIGCLARRHRGATWCLDSDAGAPKASPGYAIRRAIVSENPSAKIEVGARYRLRERDPAELVDSKARGPAGAEYQQHRRARRPDPHPLGESGSASESGPEETESPADPAILGSP
jgi:AAA domain